MKLKVAQFAVTAPWRDSATVIIAASAAATPAPEACSGLTVPVRTDYRLCLLKRSHQSSFMKNMLVFPGGAMDPSDSVLGKGVAGGPGAVCAVREAFEEAGVRLFDPPLPAGTPADDSEAERWRREVHADGAKFPDMLKHCRTSPATKRLSYWCSFTTPDVEAFRMKKGGFHTKFYVASLEDRLVKYCSCDAKETSEMVWMSPEECLASLEAGRIKLPPPQWTVITELVASVPEMSQLHQYAASPERSFMREHDIKPYLMVPEGAELPAKGGSFSGTVMAYPGDSQHPVYPYPGGVHRLTFSPSGIPTRVFSGIPHDLKLQPREPASKM